MNVSLYAKENKAFVVDERSIQECFDDWKLGSRAVNHSFENILELLGEGGE